MLACQRDRFAIPAEVHYLNCAYMAPLSHAVIAAMDEGARAKASPWRYKPADFFTVAEHFRDRAAQLAGVPSDCIAIVPSASYGLAVAACYKWLMGPYGTGMLYVAPRHHDGRPIEHNWINRAGSEDFARLVEYREDFQPGARRFDMGERLNPPLLMGASAGLDFLLDFGVEAIAKTLAAKTEAIAARAAMLGMEAAPVGVRAAHFLALGFGGGVPAGLTDRLAAREIHVSLRGASLRVTPHLYNDEADADALIAALG
jgi:selenocysteine lyase/cysteine desulfurase